MDERFRVLNTDTVLLLNEVMNADFQIQREDKVTDMCYAIEKIKEDAAKKAAKEAAISSAINTARRFGIADNSILDDIIKQFSLTLDEARNYMAMQTI
ncbi:MAG: hypothetical protein LUI14_10080 [Lachnospiraceae bacterium]|nr:hypothetical protein [Lachnospiraceae bacterium]